MMRTSLDGYGCAAAGAASIARQKKKSKNAVRLNIACLRPSYGFVFSRSFSVLSPECYIKGDTSREVAVIHLPKETEALARRLATVRGLSMEDAVKQAIEQSAREAGVASQPEKPRDESPHAVAARRARMDAIIAEIARMPVLDPRSPREITDDLNAL
jgi:antitoxin VapB